MLETEDVDDDYFTPVAKTSLASIFKKPLSGEKSENETLKYSPPIPKSTQNQEESQTKNAYENVFSCVFDSYLWIDNVYTHRGKLGCAVVKLVADESHNFHSILLYDSKKATVSSVTANKDLEITVKGKDFMSYYDRYKKYWCLYGSENDIKKIIDILINCNVIIKVLEKTGNSLPEQKNTMTAEVKTNASKKNTESDTDSSLNRKTKASILNRMANMGQSVLPPHVKSVDQTSDSSDESDNHKTSVRHKAVKNIVKKNILEKNALEQFQKPDVYKNAVVLHNQKSMENSTCMVVGDQLMPLQGSSTIASTSGTDLNYFFTEQRINNSELRINITRMTDKVDNILNKINKLDIDKDRNEGINTEILQKLLKEYESKIKTYEELLKNKSMLPDESQNSSLKNELLEKTQIMMNNELIMLKNKVTELEECITQKDIILSQLNNEIKTLRERNNNENSKQNKDDLWAKLHKYEQALLENQKCLATLTNEKNEQARIQSDQIEQKIKNIMNDIFQTIEINFNNDETYLGTDVKNIIATVIKKVTIESLNKSK